MRTNLTNFRGRTTLDLAALAAGVLLFVAPWALGFASAGAAAWNAWIVGAVIALLALGALVAFTPYEEWANLALGLWAVAAPWALGFAAIQAAVWAHVILGLVVAALAAGRLWASDGPPASHA